MIARVDMILQFNFAS